MMLAAGMALLVGACDLKRAAVLDPKGPIALAERDLLFDAFCVMMIVIVPVIILTLWFAWRYRASNTNAQYAPTWANSVKLDAFVWSIPAVIVIALGVLLWRSTYKLDPYRPIENAGPAIEVQVVAQDWKWLFIYPEQGIAVVNQLAFPAGRPVSLRITSDTVMNSFYVPQLAGQIYAMAGMQTRLQLLADQPGKFVGRNSQYSGGGYSDQHFEVLSLSQGDFDAWVAKAKQAPGRLDAQTYPAQAAKSRAVPITYYSAVEPSLYDQIIAKYRHSGHTHTQNQGQGAGAPARR
jgi:cytochrome o ubiquinol oxidase subunit 2